MFTADDFDYNLPASSIAQAAIEPRDASRLLDAGTLTDVPFSELPRLLRAGDALVVNRTRVRHARLRAARVDTGGAVEVLLVRRLDPSRWEAMLRPSRRLRSGVVLGVGPLTISLATDPRDGVATVRIDPVEHADDVIEAIGEMPLPPYFNGSLDDDERYQTMFATALGSAAAPTAALHFTPSLVERLEQAGVMIVPVELEVGLDTFRPMSDGPIEHHQMHTEHAEVVPAAADALNQVREAGGRWVAVGTTVVRTLESATGPDGVVEEFSGQTDLFIRPGHRFNAVDALITNFHAPRTTLLVMIAAMIGDRWRTVYAHALSHDFRFLSFGDAMFIEGVRP